MTTARFHGVSTVEFTDIPRPVEIADFSYLGIIGTAPDADVANWPLNTPILVLGPRNIPAGLGSTGTLYDAIDAAFDEGAGAMVIVRVTEGANIAATMGNIIGSRSLMTGLHAFSRAFPDLGIKPRVLVAPGFTSQRPTDGVLSIAVTAAGSNYETAPLVAFSGGAGSGAQAHALVEDGEVTEIIVDNPGSGYTTAPTIALTGGGGASATATATLGTVSNPVVAEMSTLLTRLRAIAYVDGPNTTPAAALQYRQDWGSDRIKIVDPAVKVWKDDEVVTQPASARWAGLRARVTRELGFWHSESNKEFRGIIGIARPITWGLNDPDTEAEYLNDNDIATIIRNINGGGYLAWGNRSTSNDPVTTFLSVRITSDVVIESVEAATMVFVDQPFSVQLLVDIGETASRFLRQLKARGAIIGSRVWLDLELNTPETFLLGELYVSYDAEGPAPAEHIIYHYHRNSGYYTQLAADAARELARVATT